MGSFEDIYIGDGLVSSILALEYYSTGFKTLEAVPAAFLYNHSRTVGTGLDGNCFRQGTSVVIEILDCAAAEDHNDL